MNVKYDNETGLYGEGDDIYTVYVQFMVPTSDGPAFEEWEEIDVRADSYDDALATGQAALEADYAEGGTVKFAEGPRIGLWL